MHEGDLSLAQLCLLIVVGPCCARIQPLYHGGHDNTLIHRATLFSHPPSFFPLPFLSRPPLSLSLSLSFPPFLLTSELPCFLMFISAKEHTSPTPDTSMVKLRRKSTTCGAWPLRLKYRMNGVTSGLISSSRMYICKQERVKLELPPSFPSSLTHPFTPSLPPL